jgi:hypothetical protein
MLKMDSRLHTFRLRQTSSQSIMQKDRQKNVSLLVVTCISLSVSPEGVSLMHDDRKQSKVDHLSTIDYVY